MRRIFTALELLLMILVWSLTTALLVIGVRAHAQQPTTMKYGLVIGPAFDSLTAAWPHRGNVETAWCVTKWAKIPPDDKRAVQDTLYLVGDVMRAKSITADHDNVTFECPNNDPSVHIHLGWNDPYFHNRVGDCNPSRTDYGSLEAAHQEFGVVQCDSMAFVFFFASQSPLSARSTKRAVDHTVFWNGSRGGELEYGSCKRYVRSMEQMYGTPATKRQVTHWLVVWDYDKPTRDGVLGIFFNSERLLDCKITLIPHGKSIGHDRPQS